jgi:phage baseplate assembly protein W
MADPIYKGIAFPFQKGSTSFPKTATDNDLIRQSLIQIVLTPKGSRIMRPEFGTNALTHIFENNTTMLGLKIRGDVSAAISKFEPRVSLRGIGVARTDSSVIITIGYLVKATQEQDRVVLSMPVQ